MIRQAFDLVCARLSGSKALRPRRPRGAPLGRQRLDGLDQARVQPPPPLLEERTIGHLVCQGMLEGVFRLGEQTRLIQKLRRLEVRQATVQRCLGHVRNGLEQRQEHLSANNGSRLQEPLRLRRQPVNACSQHRLHRGRYLNR
jgi:hypothetical protein